MKASEVLKEYTDGERNFRNANLRGQSFRGKNLSGADFSYAKIQSADFSNANLKNVKFIGAEAGLQRRWAISLLVASFIIAVISGFSSWAVKEQSVLLSIITLVLVAFILALIKWKNFTKSWKISIPILLTILISTAIVIAVQFGLGVIFVLAIGSMLVGVSIAAVVAEVGFFAAIKYCILISACGVGFFLTTGTTFDIISATIQVMLCGIFFCYWTITKCQKDLPFLYSITIALSAALGTNFRGADLTNADFTKATLKSTNFAGANLTHTCWRNIKNLDRVHPGNTYLQNAKLRNLLITGEGRKEIFDRCQDLRGVNLRKAKLENISFIKTDLCEANLQEATLTGACIEDWNINSETNLEGVICDYVYLKEGKQERRPHDPNKNFAPGEFTKLFQKALETVDLIFREGVDWKAFAYSFQNLQVVNQDTPLAIQSIESKGDGVVLIRVSVSRRVYRHWC
jgi:uncharacterized protein YjbI with pentapeptide repeats